MSEKRDNNVCALLFVKVSLVRIFCWASCNGRVQWGSLQKVQGHRAGVNADLTPSTGGPVGHACR